MPLGYFGSSLAILVLTLLTPFAYVYVWPRAVTRRPLFLVVTLSLAPIVAVVLENWYLDAVEGVGGSFNRGEVAARLRARYYTACLVAVLVEYLICRAAQYFLKKK
jgi:hypothetical protein